MKKCVIYDNYDLCDMFDDCKEFLKEEYEESEITDNMVWNEIYLCDEINWNDEYERLKDFFTGRGYFMIRGHVGRWNGQYAVGYVFNDFDDAFDKAVKHCDYIKLWDENGHFYLQCSHHDGTNFFEIKRINYKAYDFIDKWFYNCNDERPEEEIHDIIWNSNFLSGLPHYARFAYGCR